jgi:hypothetical protein
MRQRVRKTIRRSRLSGLRAWTSKNPHACCKIKALKRRLETPLLKRTRRIREIVKISDC